MSNVSFTNDQIREIHRRINDAHTKSALSSEYTRQFGLGVDAVRENALDKFPLAKVKVHRTFTVGNDVYRVNGSTVEYLSPLFDKWLVSSHGHSFTNFAGDLIFRKKWDELAIFADICKNPTEEKEA